MSSKPIIPRLVLKRKGGCNVFAQIAALAHLHPDMTTGELEAALDSADFAKQCDQAIIEKDKCPIGLDKIQCPSCRFATDHGCGWNEFKTKRGK
jgi:hypothetical protein